MIELTRQGLVPSQGLSDETYTAILELAAVCNEHAQITLKLNYEILRKRPFEEINDYLYYESGQLVGFLGLYQFNNHEVELSGMVHPEHRRQGIFSALVAAARQEIKRRHIPKLIYMVQQGSASGKAFLEMLGAPYEFSEYWMRMVESKLPPMRDPLELRSIVYEDLPTIAHMIATCFDLNEQEMLESMRNRHEIEPSRNRTVISLNGEDIGTIAMNYAEENEAFIYGFCILPEKQGRGYGRQALALTIQKALADGRNKIELEVACENKNALNLYRTCGFEVQNANDYYVQQIELTDPIAL